MHRDDLPQELHLEQFSAAYLTISCISILCHCGNLASPEALGIIADVREVANNLSIAYKSLFDSLF